MIFNLKFVILNLLMENLADPDTCCFHSGLRKSNITDRRRSTNLMNSRRAKTNWLLFLLPFCSTVQFVLLFTYSRAQPVRKELSWWNFKSVKSKYDPFTFCASQPWCSDDVYMKHAHYQPFNMCFTSFILRRTKKLSSSNVLFTFFSTFSTSSTK